MAQRLEDFRFQPIAVDGKWFVYDTRYPDSRPTEAEDETDAMITAIFMTMLTNRASHELEES